MVAALAVGGVLLAVMIAASGSAGAGTTLRSD
jgi:hypothetical protein